MTAQFPKVSKFELIINQLKLKDAELPTITTQFPNRKQKRADYQQIKHKLKLKEGKLNNTTTQFSKNKQTRADY